MASTSGPYWPNITLNNGVKMPSVGLGTYQMKDPDVLYNAVDVALAAGYRLFDTAAVYGNEVYLNRAFKELLPKYDLNREDIFITSKLSNNHLGSDERAKRAYRRSLLHLGVDYLDLYLIHFPGAAKLKCDDEKNKTMRNESWAGLVELYESGQVSAIGVSNYTSKHIDDLLDEKYGYTPAVNQFEFHPYYQDNDLLRYCYNSDINVQAYHSFGGTAGKEELLQHPEVVAIAKDVDATPAQVLLVWALQKDVAVIPKASTPEHIKNNICLTFKLTQEHMETLESLDKQKKFAWDPSLVA